MAIKNSLTYDLDINSILDEYSDIFNNPNYYKPSEELLTEYKKIVNDNNIYEKYFDLKEMDKLNILNEAISKKVKIEDTDAAKKIFNK